MSEDGRKYTDPELEKFLKENKEMMERLFRENKEMMDRFFREEKERIRDAFDEEIKRAEAFSGEKKDKAKDAAQEVYNAFTDPEVQRHFLAMGMEFMMGMNALISAMPFPEQMKDMAKKAEEARKSTSENFSKAGADRGKGMKPAPPEKINVEPAPKKSQSKAKKSSADRDDS